MKDCPIGFGIGWVCENHPDRAWHEELGCMCGAGMREPPNSYDDKADNPPWIKALAEVRRLAPREGWCYQHVQAIIVDTPKRRSATENPFLIKPHGKASFIARAGQSATEYQFGYAQNRKSKRRAA